MTLAIAIDFLTGRYVATAHHDRDQPEWPAHPARVFSALVAALHDGEDPDPAEREALEWLEQLAPPSIAASPASPRPTVTHYVPVNDAQVLGLSLTERRYAKLRTSMTRLENARTDAKRASARRAIEQYRDVSVQVRKAGATPLVNAQRLLPQGRGRQPRTFPSVTPEAPTMTLLWDDIDPRTERTDALAGLLDRLTRLGHSSSLVWARLVEVAPVPALVPDVDGDQMIRTTGQGQLAALERRHTARALRAGDPPGFQDSGPRTMPSAMTRYRWVGVTPADGAANLLPQRSALSGEWFVFEQIAGRRMGSWAGLSVARAVRAALMSHLDAQHSLISGHQADGTPVTEPHLVVLPLPFVGHPHASGLLMGVALQLPAESPLLTGRDQLLRAIGRWEGAHAAYHAVLHTERGEQLMLHRTTHPEATTLRRSMWAGPATQWVTATPIALDRHPKHWGHRQPDKHAAATQAAAAAVSAACRHVGLDEPTSVEVSLQPLSQGCRPASRYLPYDRGTGPNRRRRFLVHARLRFAQPVAGPLVIGAGRYLGVGLLRPQPSGRDTQ